MGKPRLLNERAKFILYDEYKIRLQKPEDNFMGFDPPVCLIDPCILTDADSPRIRLVGRFGVKGGFTCTKFGIEYLYDGQLLGFCVENPPAELWEAMQSIRAHGWGAEDYFGIRMEESYWPEYGPIQV